MDKILNSKLETLNKSKTQDSKQYNSGERILNFAKRARRFSVQSLRNPGNVLTQKMHASQAFFARRAAAGISLEIPDKGGVCRIKCVGHFGSLCFCSNFNSIV